MSLSTIRTASVAALLSAAAFSDARAQEAFVSTDPLVTEVAAPEVAGTVMELDQSALKGQSLHAVVARQHAGWLQRHGVRGVDRTGVVVYCDGVAIGGAETLRRIAASEVGEVRRLDSREAARRFGLGHEAGAILITSK